MMRRLTFELLVPRIYMVMINCVILFRILLDKYRY